MMEWDKLNSILFGLFLLGMLIIAVVSVYNIFNNIFEYQKEIPKMIYQDKYSKHEWQGVYIPGCGFFVDTRGQNFDEINQTITHESVHTYLEHNNKTHFCKEDN